jgi:hypothetical protein
MEQQITEALTGHSSFEYLGIQGDGAHVVVCGCHNPDENGVGAQQFSGVDPLDAIDAWMQHVADVIERALPASLPVPPTGATRAYLGRAGADELVRRS